jgi:hypothetical protein
MKSIFRIVTTLLIAISIVAFAGTDSIKTIASIGTIEVSSNLSESLIQQVDDHLYPTEDGYIDRNGKIVLKLPPKSHSTLPRTFSDGFQQSECLILTVSTNQDWGILTGLVKLSCV